MLKQLKIQKALELKRQKLKELETKAADILKRSENAQRKCACVMTTLLCSAKTPGIKGKYV